MRLDLMRALVVCAIAVAGGPGEASAEPRECFSSLEEAGEWMVGYHLAPDPERVICSLRFFAYSEDPRVQKQRLGPLHFYAELSRTDASLRKALFDAGTTDADGEMQSRATVIFWLMDTAEGRELLERAAAEWTSTPAGGLATLLSARSVERALDRRITTPEEAIRAADDLDGLWYTFFATGKEAPLRRIVAALPMAFSENDLEKVVGETALWSLKSNASQHARVRTHLVKIGKTAQEPTKGFLMSLLIEATGGAPAVVKKQQLPWDAKAGALSISFLITDRPEEFFRAWNKPSEGVRVDTTSKARRGIPIVGAVVFEGCAPDAAGLCDVVMDFELKDPRGALYHEQRGVEFWNAKPPPPEGRIELGTGYLAMVFEPDDPVGVYTATVTIRDRNSKTNVSASKELELVAD